MSPKARASRSGSGEEDPPPGRTSVPLRRDPWPLRRAPCIYPSTARGGVGSQLPGVALPRPAPSAPS